MPQIELLHTDCMEYMAGLPDKAFDLAIVDPPYGIGENWKKDRFSDFYRHRSSYANEQAPDSAYFQELFRVSTHQIIWGANYYWQHLRPTTNIIVWDKGGDPVTQHISACELAWTSITEHAGMVIRLWWTGFVRCEPRYGTHPHEKPVSLYAHLLRHYAKPGMRILDTHGGGMSIAIACDIEGFDLTLCEIDADYFAAGKKRLADHQAQPRLFTPEPPQSTQLQIDPAA